MLSTDNVASRHGGISTREVELLPLSTVLASHSLRKNEGFTGRKGMEVFKFGDTVLVGHGLAMN